MVYKYFIYGLNVESELELAEAYKNEFDSAPDVRIIRGDMPDEVKQLFSQKPDGSLCVAATEDEIAYIVRDVGEFLVTKDTIIVSEYEGAIYSNTKGFILGSSFGYNMILRGNILLHGGAVARDGKGIIITGQSGAGKSTVSDALLSQGYLFIADDTCAVSTKDDKPHIQMGYPQQKLCRDAAIKKGYDLSELIMVNEARDKYGRILTDGFLPNGADLNYLFELVNSEDDKVTFEEVTGHDKLMTVMRNIFRGKNGFSIWGIAPDYMKKCLVIADKISIYRVSRPKDKDTLEEIAEFIESVVQ